VRTVFTAAAVALSLALAGAAAASQASPLETLKAEIAYAASGQYEQLYELYTDKFQKGCPFARFEREMGRIGPQFEGVTVKLLKQRVEGTQATLDYRLVKRGRTLSKTRGDVYAEIGGRWYDEVDRYTSC
jgi:hypothetical protein